MEIKGPYSEENTIQTFADIGLFWPSRAERWKNLSRTVCMASNAQFLIIFGREGTPEEGQPVAAQGWALFDGVKLGQGLRNPAGIARKGYASRVSKEVFAIRDRRPAVIFPNEGAWGIYTSIGFRYAGIEDVRSLSSKLAENFEENIPDFESWNAKLMILG